MRVVTKCKLPIITQVSHEAIIYNVMTMVNIIIFVSY